MFSGGMAEKMQEKMMQQVTPSDTTIGVRVANILTTTEYELFAAVDRLVEAADDVDGEFHVPEEMEARRDRILDVADAVAAQEFEEWWWDNYATDFVDNAEHARKFAGITKSEWRDAMGKMADYKRDQLPESHPVQGETDAQVAARRVEELFDVDLATFASEVVEWTAAEHVDAIVRQNLRTSTETIHQVAAALEEGE